VSGPKGLILELVPVFPGCHARAGLNWRGPIISSAKRRWLASRAASRIVVARIAGPAAAVDLLDC